MASTPIGEKPCTKTPGDYCESVSCENCRGLQAVHESGSSSRTRVNKKKHEKTESDIAAYVRSVLEPELTEEQVIESHVSNVFTFWFGIQIDEKHSTQDSLKSKPFLELASGSERDPSSQHPCLVSFVGETGAGKSTLINAMMKSVGTIQIEEITPVIGTKIDSPTSGDVHLFPDPKSLKTNRPLFFADCEGFGGGNIAPLAARAKESNKKFKHNHHPHRARTRKREMTTSEQYTRQWAVDQLYPRILFTFSDIVCLVSKNFRKIENHIVDLLTWANNVFEKSLNQPILPKAIIVVNGVDCKSDEWWDVDKVTNEQLNIHRNRIYLYCEPSTSSSYSARQNDGTTPQTPIPDDFVARLAHEWRTERNKAIKSLNDLILCYYSDFKIICIPSANHPPHIINKQYTKLGGLISTGARDSKNARKLAGRLMTSEDLDYYLEQGFDHFSTSKLPFNFLQAALHAKHVSIRFSDHLLRAALILLRQRPNDSGVGLLGDLAAIFASSIFLDVIRKKIPYKGNSTHIFDKYRQPCGTAQRELYQKYWYCEERDRHGKRCANCQNGHAKGHQDHGGKVFRAGNFSAAYKLDSLDQIELFGQNIIRHLQWIFNNWEGNLPGIVPEEEKRKALELHLARTSILYGHDGADDILPKLTSHTICLCCLISTPVHLLFCGHVICQECLEGFAKKEKNDFELSKCPLHGNTGWTRLWRTNFSPPTSGLRILSLDGGGVRSIVQLTILKELEQLIGLGVNIVDFFDLIIGTSGGGIVAVGLGIKKFSTKECIEMFQQVSKQAFTKRTLVDGLLGPILGPVIEAQHHSRYKTTKLTKALQEVFGEKTILFGGQSNPASKSTVRVGVSTTTSGGSAFLLANYQRSQLTYPLVGYTGYSFYRGETAEEELKVWEALRATSAAPRYFKSFYHKASGHTFDDGGIRYNNPVVLANTERKIIWPEQKERDPDILLSIGTLWSDKVKSDPKKSGKDGSGAGFGPSRYARKFFNIAVNAIKNDLDCEKTWSSFYNSLNIAEEDGYRKKKYCRINPKIPNAPPALDSVSSMNELQEIAQKYCSTSPEIRNVASALIASLFYFELKNAKESPQAGRWSCEGEILCRLPAKSESLEKLCNRLLKQHKIGNNHQSWFRITSIRDERRQPCRILGSVRDVFNAVSAGGHFCLPLTFKKWEYDASCQIYVSLDDPKGEGSLISGFPRDPLKDRTWPHYRNFLTDKRKGEGGGPGAKHMDSYSLDHPTGSRGGVSLLGHDVPWDSGDERGD